jgi:endo-1,4-beta-xylanase
MRGLKDVFAPHFLMGVALGGKLPETYSEAERALIAAHFNVITPENCMKPGPIHPTEETYQWEQADALVAFAQAQKMQVTAHCLVWHSQCPDWFFLNGTKSASRDLVLARMRAHIHAVMGRYKGKVLGWDVVNEAIADGEGELRASKWRQSIGDDFIEKAFEYAHEADPAAELYYNDYSIEMPGKRQKTLNLIARLKAKGLRIDAVGIQGHWELDRVPFKAIEEAIVAYRDAGVKVMITELDLDVVSRAVAGADLSAIEAVQKNDPYVAGLPPQVQERQAAQYAELFRLLRRHEATITRVTFWGLHDGRSWLNSWPRPRTNHALLFDRQSQPKPACTAVVAEGMRR